jgi:hypothetical protein
LNISTPREALDLLDQVAQNFLGNRQDHVNLQNAVTILNALILKTEQKTEEAELRFLSKDKSNTK